MKPVGLIGAAALIACAFSEPASAYEAGFIGWMQKPGTIIGGGSAGVPPPGIYAFEQLMTYHADLVGPTAPKFNGIPTHLSSDVSATGLLFVPGWTFLGATYDAVIVQPVPNVGLNAPINYQQGGLANTYLVPAELSWKLGDSGFFVKAGIGIYAPTGGAMGNPWWTFLPELAVSYLKDGWNFTAIFLGETYTKNTVTGYTNGNMLHVEAKATKTIGKWTFGPVGYYYGQISDDKSSAFYSGAINVNRFNIAAVGGLVAYDFGPVALTVWGFDEVHSDARGLTSATGSTVNGWSVNAQVSFRIWAPDEPGTGSTPKLFHK